MSEATSGFVVKATMHGGQSLWVSRPSVDGIRTLVSRERADVFATPTEAHVAIGTMSRVFRGRAYIYTVQVAD